MIDYSESYDENLNHKGSLLNSMVDDESSIESLLAGITAGNLGRGVFGAFNKTIGIEFNVDKSDQLAILQSRNFVSGSAGWRLDSDGNFEGQSGTFRGIIKTATSGQRITINETANTMIFYDASGQVIGIGTSLGVAMRVDLTANTDDGIQVFSTITSSVGYRYENSGNVLNSGLIIVMSGSTNNTGNSIRIDHDGAGGYGILLDLTNAATGIYIGTTSSGDALTIVNSGSNNSMDITDSSSASAIAISKSGSNNMFNLLHSINTVMFQIENQGSSNTFAILDQSTGETIRIDKNAAGNIISLDLDANSAAACYAIVMDIQNAGAGLEYAFYFQGAEHGITAAGNGGFVSNNLGTFTLVGFVRVNTGAGTAYIPYGTIA